MSASSISPPANSEPTPEASAATAEAPAGTPAPITAGSAAPTESPAPAESPATTAPVTLQIFISYSRNDTDFMLALRKHLAPLEQARLVHIWADDRIALAEQWSQAIEQAMRRADVALLLLSADFFASEFIQQRELPALQARVPEGLKLIPIIIRDIDWQGSALSAFQAPLQGQPISTPQNDAAWVKVASEIRYLCNAAQPGAAPAAAEIAQHNARFAEGPPIVTRSLPPTVLRASLPSSPTPTKSRTPTRALQALFLLALGTGVFLVAGGWLGKTKPQGADPGLQNGLQRVSRALDLGDLGQAEQLLTELQEHYATSPELSLAQATTALYRPTEARSSQSFYDELERLHHQSQVHGGLFAGQLHVARANRRLFEMKWQEARDAFRQALLVQPQLVTAQLGLGVLDLWQNRPNAALERFNKAQAHAPNSAEVQTAIGASELQLRNFVRASHHYESALQHDPTYLAAHLELAKAYRLAGKPQQALAALERLEGHWAEYADLPSNQAPLGYRLGPSAARIASLQEPPVLFLHGQDQLQYYFRLSLALSACLSDSVHSQAFRHNLEVAQRLRTAGLSPDRALRARLLLVDELDNNNRECIAAIERARAPRPPVPPSPAPISPVPRREPAPEPLP